MNNKILIAIMSVIVLIVAACLVVYYYDTYSIPQFNKPNSAGTVRNTATTTPKVFPDTTVLKIKDFKVGTGPAVTATSKITFDFVGILTNGKVFSSTASKGPITLTLGTTTIIKGWQDGIVGMKVGGQRRLVIPPQLGYGSTGIAGEVPPNATLIYDISLQKIVK